MRLYHDSRDPFYRWPFGAVSCGQRVRVRLRVEADQAPDLVFVRTWNGAETRSAMRMLGAQEGGYLYEAEIETCDHPCLMWYRFGVQKGEETILYGNAADNLGGVGLQGNADSYQITVCDPAYDTPRWMREGVMYQIMVDRFYNGVPDGSLLRKRDDVRVHADWYERPDSAIAHNGDGLARDFFGGNLEGVRQKLPYLRDLGVTVLYLNPIFRARSNHKYDTGDYREIDPMFGTEEDFARLCRDARAMGIRVMLDGVFSHVGDDSRYFNRYGRYPDVGAYQSKDSPYASWFRFKHFPDSYDCWWGFDTLPNVNEENPDYLRFMLEDDDAVTRHWLRAGASGWRLDVADELPMSFLRRLRARVKDVSPDCAVLGEVWEDASHKVTYDKMRSYVLGDTLDSVMNYPLREALIAFLRGEKTALQAARTVEALRENYPKPFFYSLMNLLGSHDRARIIDVLADARVETLARAEREAHALTKEQRELGVQRTRMMLRVIACLPGMPCIYYGDEAGMTGAGDPLCRAAYPWGREDQEQLAFFHQMLRMRAAHPVLVTGEMRMLAPCADVLGVVRTAPGGRDAFGRSVREETAICLINRSEGPVTVRVPEAELGCDVLCGTSGERVCAQDGALYLTVPPRSGETFFRARGGFETLKTTTHRESIAQGRVLDYDEVM